MKKKQVDVCIALYGKPYHTIVTIKSMLLHSSQHIDKFIIIKEPKQPHDDYVGIHTIIDYFRNDPAVKFEIFTPKHFLGLGVFDIERAKVDKDWRQSIMFQYAFEATDKKYLVLTHNDILYHGDMIGAMLAKAAVASENIMGVGTIGQCWSCPAGPNWGNVCDSHRMNEFVPTKQEAIALAKAHATPRQAIQLKVIEAGRVHPLPECRLNEYCCLIDVDKYRKETLPTGDLGCYGGGWNGVDIATVWSHDVYQRGYRFLPMTLEDFGKHSPFDVSGSGTKSYSSTETYFESERIAKEYIERTWGGIRTSTRAKLAFFQDEVKRKGWLMIVKIVGAVKKLIGK